MEFFGEAKAGKAADAFFDSDGSETMNTFEKVTSQSADTRGQIISCCKASILSTSMLLILVSNLWTVRSPISMGSLRMHRICFVQLSRTTP